ncbi:MAG: outer membrane protein assembly factor BamA, partial [Muribaculaceae bacterium]|nr:outer membrane protein assembly factor BamA [Muribaculaceae bacterium]
MRYKIFLILMAAVTLAGSVKAQEPTDTIYNPQISYAGVPRTYEIAGIEVSGADNYEDSNIIGYTGLRIGQKIEIPGNDVTAAAKRLMRQQLFAQAQIKVTKIAGNKVWLELAMRTQPRISQVNYIGMKKGEREDLQERLQLIKGNPITPNIVNRATDIVEKYFAEKGFGNADVSISQRPDLSEENHVIVDIIANKRDKIKVHKIYIDGNEVLSDNQLQRVMKKTNEKGKLLNLFKQKKFVEQDYEDDLNRILEKYNEKGYRDAKILADSVVPYDDKTVDVYISLEEGKKYYINDIQWVGNTVYPTDWLNSVLGIEPGSVYNQKLLNKRTKDDDDAVANYYLDNGYLFYQLVPIEKNVHGDSIDLELRMFEGPQARINKVIINGNDRLYEKVIRRELRVRPGELFSKNDLMRSAREIAQTGHFNPEAMDIRPEPNEDDGTVDILFNLESKANDQIEFSLGWGQTGIIGKLALKFTNFSIKNLFQPDSYKGLIPQGEGQTFTISAQTNARYYQAYSLSFLDPWFGGKRPNSLSVSAYYSRQTGVNSNYYNSNWSNPYGYGYGYGFGSNYNYNDYYQNSIQNAYDPNKLLQMAGITVGFGKRLSWPDDYFTFTTELSYNWYYLKNWEYLY